MGVKQIYIAATNQHVGKTTSTLGIASLLMQKKINVGYCKPVGQQHLSFNDLIVDKDTVLFADLIKFDLDPKIHSPVILGKGATEAYIDNPENYDFINDIKFAQKEMEKKHDIIIHEGTGHPGVGSVCDVSNATVAKTLGASVIMVVEGGIGKTIDRLNMSLALFREQNVPIDGIIVNKVIVSKIDKIKKYMGKWCDKTGIKLLGVVPYDHTLAYPVIWTISKKIKGTFIENSHKGGNKVSKTVPGSVIEKDIYKSKDVLMIVSAKKSKDAMIKLNSILKMNNVDNCPLSGIVITGHGEIDEYILEYVEKNELPLIKTEIDTYGVYLKISRLEVKINRRTPWKVLRAIELIEEHVDLNFLLEK